jgi:hypothetical protein
MKLPISRGNLFGWFQACLLLLAAGGWVSPQDALAQLYPKEYIRIQPQSAIGREGDSVGLEVEYAFGYELQDQTAVLWYRNGAYVGTSIPVLQTYTTPDGPKPKLWDPYKMPRGQVYDDAASAATADSVDAKARWVATYSISALTADTAGMYYAKVADVGTIYNWTYTNFVQVVMVPRDPAKSMEIVRHPSSRSVSAPNSDPVPGVKLYGDMRSHVSPIMNTPFGAATDAEGFTFIADTLNHCIRRVSPGGHVTTLAGMDGQPYVYAEPSQYDLTNRNARTRKERDPVPGFRAGVTNQSLVPTDPTAYRYMSTTDVDNQFEPLFRFPEAVAVSDIGVVYVADTGNHAIRSIRTVGNVTTVSDLYGSPQSSNLRSPRGVFFAGSSADPVNNPPVLYVLDSANYSVKKLYLNELDGSLDTSQGDPEQFPDFPNQRTGCERIAGLGQTPGWQGVTVSAADAKFYSPRGIVFTKDPATGAETLYIADTVNHVIRQLVRVNNVWTARTVVGFVGAKGNVNAVGTAARLNFPVGLALDEVNQLLYFTEFGNHSLRRVNLPFNSRQINSQPVTAWTVDNVAGSGFYGPTKFGPNGAQGSGNGDGLGTDAVFYYPAGISFNKVDGSILLADTNNNLLRKVRIATTGANAWVGDSSAFAGTVGISGNRDFSELPEFTYRWKKDALLITDNAPATFSSISGSRTDTLAVTNVQYEDAGVYALVVSNAFAETVETTQAFVYIATAGDPPKFLNPGYRIEDQAVPGVPLVDLRKGMDIFVSADILPADQVTYQWEMTEDAPDENGDYQWIALSDLPIGIQTLNNPKDPDTVRNAQRIRLGTLLGTATTTISGATTARLALSQLQVSLTSVPPKLRFRVQAFTKAVPPLPLDTKVERTTMNATWTVAPPQTVAVGTSTGTLQVGMTLSGSGIAPGTRIRSVDGGTLTLDTPATGDQITPGTFTATLGSTVLTVTGSWAAVPEQTVTVDSADNLSVGMYLVGPGIVTDTRIKAIDTSGLSVPGAVVLTLDTPVSAPGTNVQIAGADEVAAGTGLSIRYPVILVNQNLSIQLPGLSARQLANSEMVPLASGGSLSLFLTAGTSSAQGNPTPVYQWYKRDTPTGTQTPIPGATSPTYTFGAVQTADRGFYSVSVSNGVGAALESHNVFLNVARPPTLALVSMNVDGGSLTQNVSATVAREADKTKTPGINFTVNVDASVIPDFSWSYLPAGATAPTTDLSRFSPAYDRQLTYGSLSIANVPDDADGTFTVTASVPGVADRTCSWSLVVKALPTYVPGSKLFTVGTLNVAADSHTVDLNEGNSLFLKADFTSPRTLPLTYRWRRDRVILASGTNSLSVNRLTKTDMGTYKLEVTNAMGTLVFGPVTGAEVAFPGNPPLAGWRLIASGKPSVVAQPWGKSLASSPANVSAALAGMVAAAPRPVAGPLASPMAQTVLRVARGQRVALQVAVDADPPPTYQWYRALDEDLLFSSVPGAVSPIYVLTVPTNDPVGKKYRFYVEATNALLKINNAPPVRSEEIIVQVEGLPDPVVTGTAISNPAWAGAPAPFPSGSVVILSAAVTDSSAEYSYQWKVNGNQIFGATSKTLTLANIEPGQAGFYTVVATGVAGSKESAVYSVTVSPTTLTKKYAVALEGNEEMRMVVVLPSLTTAGLAPGTKVALTGVAPSSKMLQSWRVSYTNEDNAVVSSLLPARAAQFIMPAADVTVTPILSRPHTGTYTGLLTLEAPWIPEDEWAVSGSKDGDFFRPRGLDMALGKIRGMFVCSVSSSGAVSGQIQLENKTLGFTTALDAEMRGTFRIATTLRGFAWNLNGTIAFNTTEENRSQDYVDNVAHVVLKDVLLSTPPLVPVGQTLYCTAAGVLGAGDALSADLQEVETSQAAQSSQMYFTAAVYRETNGETKETSIGQAAVISAQVRQGTGAVLLRGYLGNGARVTASATLGRAFITPEMEGPDVISIYPGLVPAAPFVPASTLLSGQAGEALSEVLLRRSTSQSVPVWLRGDTATTPVYGAMIFNGPKVYGSLGALGLNTANNLSEYTPNGLAGYFYDAQSPDLTNLPANSINTDQTTVLMTTPDSYPTGLAVNWPTAAVVPQTNVVQASVDRETGLLFGGMIESTAKYLQTASPYGPVFAGRKSLLACTTAAVYIQRIDTLPGLNYPPGSPGGYFGFIYRGKNATLEPLRNVLGSGVPEASVLPTPTGTGRIEPLRITFGYQY